MAAYDITSPDGQTFRITAPDGATQDQVLAYAQKNFKLAASPAKSARSWSDVPLEALKNVPSSGFHMLSGIASAVTHPIDTVSSLMDMAAGGLRNLAPASVRSAIDALDTPEQQQSAIAASTTADAVGQFYKGRYGGLSNLRDTLATDPVGVFGDAATVLAGGAGAARLGANVAALAPRASAVAGALDRASSAINPLTPVVNLTRTAVQRAAPYVQTKGGNLLAESIGASPAELRAMALAAKNAPESIVDGSRLTFSQALTQQGLRDPNVALLENIASGGPGGNVLLKRYAEQATARSESLRSNGAETYLGAGADVADTTGNYIGSMLRTQARDDSLAAKQAWKGGNGQGGVYGQALRDNVHLTLPLDEMTAAMAPLGRGSVLPAKDANRVLAMAHEIGTMALPELAPLKASPVGKSQSLEQAVRAAGGIRGRSGELRDLGIRESTTTGLINNKSGQSADILAEAMYARGYLPDPDPATLLDALRNGGGRKLFANDQIENNSLQRMAEHSMGEMPAAERIRVPVPFDEFQRLRRDSGSLGAALLEKTGGQTEGGVLQAFNGLLTKAADDAAVQGNGLLGTNMSPEFLAQYNAARELTRRNVDLYQGGNNIAQILRKPVGQNYTLNGNEITNKLWHGSQGLLGDVEAFKNTLNDNNFNPAVNALRRHVMTDVAGRTKASGDLGAALPKYVEARYPALQELLQPEQFNAVRNVAIDIKNAEAAALTGVRGSDTQAKITRALSAGLLDSPLAKTLGKFTTLKGLGGEPLRAWLAKMSVENKGQMVSELLANPKQAAAALQDSDFVRKLDPPTLKRLSATAKLSPIVAADVSASQRY